MQDVWKWVGPSVSIGFCFVQFLFQKQFGVSSLSASTSVSGAPHRGRGETEWPARNRTRAELKGVSNPYARKREERSREHWTRRTLKPGGCVALAHRRVFDPRNEAKSSKTSSLGKFWAGT